MDDQLEKLQGVNLPKVYDAKAKRVVLLLKKVPQGDLSFSFVLSVKMEVLYVQYFEVSTCICLCS